MSSLLFVSTVVCFSGHLAPKIIKYVVSTVYSENKTDQILRAEMHELEKEMAVMSLVNEFARFTRLQRRHTKLKDTLTQNVSERLTSRTKTQLYLAYGNKLIITIISLLLMYMYGREPVISLPNKLLWPFEKFLSWRSSHENAISLTAWMILTRIVGQTCRED